MSDRRCWRYRAGEAKIFTSPEEVPTGEGWVDSPALVVDSPALDRAGIMARLTEIGVSFFKGASTEKLAALLAEKEA